MSARDDGGPAFPCASPDGMVIVDMRPGMPNHVHIAEHDGMTLRDYFAAKAMPLCLPTLRELREDLSEDVYRDAFARAARVAYVMADAMLAARSA